jgi:hypothetical protein
VTASATRFGHAGPLAGGDGQAIARHWLREELYRTLLEMQRLSEENDALRKSAEIWIRMYEAQLARADRMAAELNLARTTARAPEPRAAQGPARD